MIKLAKLNALSQCGLTFILGPLIVIIVYPFTPLNIYSRIVFTSMIGPITMTFGFVIFIVGLATSKGKSSKVPKSMPIESSGKNTEIEKTEIEPKVEIDELFRQKLYDYLKNNQGAAYTVMALQTRLESFVNDPKEREFGNENLETILNKMRAVGTIRSVEKNDETHYFY
ncbi:MAG: hypothetical protein ACFFDF_04870 [Candidatus Odinarchaeota archaeon]